MDKETYSVMSRLSYDSNGFYLDGQPFQIISGTIHYFRVVPEYWEDRLRKLKECGMNAVETYTCWNLHERKEGVFDFSGGLNLAQYLEIIAWRRSMTSEELPTPSLFFLRRSRAAEILSPRTFTRL